MHTLELINNCVYRGNLKQRNQHFEIIRTERFMTDAAINKVHESNLRAFTVGNTNAYVVDSTGASVSLGSSLSLINQYCEKLPRDKYEYILLYSSAFYLHEA